MKITKELNSISDFEFWGGAEDTVSHLTSDQMERLANIIEMDYPDGIDATDLNDIFAYEEDVLADYLGFSDFQELVRYNEGEDDDDEEDDDDL